MTPAVRSVLWYAGRVMQLFAVWVVLANLLMSGPAGPASGPFFIAVVVFAAGWFLVRKTS